MLSAILLTIDNKKQVKPKNNFESVKLRTLSLDIILQVFSLMKISIFFAFLSKNLGMLLKIIFVALSAILLPRHVDFIRSKLGLHSFFTIITGNLTDIGPLFQNALLWRKPMK